MTGHTLLTDLDSSAARSLVASELVKWRAMAGEALPGLISATPNDTDGVARLGVLITDAMIASMRSDADSTDSSVATARPLAAAHRTTVPFADELLDLNEFLGLVIRGRLRDAESFAVTRHERPSSDATGLWSYTRALLALHTGRAAEALELATRAARELEWRDFTGVRSAALALRATAEAQNGEDPERTLSMLDESAYGDVKVRLQIAEARAWTLLLSGEPAAAAAIAAEALTDGMASHHVTLAGLTATVAIRADRAETVSTALGELAESTGGVLLTTLHHWSTANRADDLADAARRLDEVGLVAPAVEAWEAAAAIAGTTEQARSWRRAAARCSGDAALLLLAKPSTHAVLTERERTIARAAASRLRSNEIASDLGVSIRTVDNTLARVYRKLGIRSRLDLPAALSRIE